MPKTLPAKEFPRESRRAYPELLEAKALLLPPGWPSIPVTTPHTFHVMALDKGEPEAGGMLTHFTISVSLSAQLESWGKGVGMRDPL